MFKSLFKKTVPANEYELELIGLLQEENAETTQLGSKVRRFGWESRNPFVPNSKTNRELLQDEIGDVLAVVALMVKSGCVDVNYIMARSEWKEDKLRSQGYAPPE